VDVIKIFSPYEHFFYLKRRQEYEQKQMELIQPLMTDQAPERMKSLTYSIKQIGISSTNAGKFGIASQRKFISTIASVQQIP
jgi:hypothetical protein